MLKLTVLTAAVLAVLALPASAPAHKAACTRHGHVDRCLHHKLPASTTAASTAAAPAPTLTLEPIEAQPWRTTGCEPLVVEEAAEPGIEAESCPA